MRDAIRKTCIGVAVGTSALIAYIRARHRATVADVAVIVIVVIVVVVVVSSPSI